MAQFPVTTYTLEVSTTPPPTPGVTDFIPRVLVLVQTANGNQQVQLPLKSTAEFMAICALIQTPGKLIFESTQETLAKIGP